MDSIGEWGESKREKIVRLEKLLVTHCIFPSLTHPLKHLNKVFSSTSKPFKINSWIMPSRVKRFNPFLCPSFSWYRPI